MLKKSKLFFAALFVGCWSFSFGGSVLELNLQYSKESLDPNKDVEKLGKKWEKIFSEELPKIDFSERDEDYYCLLFDLALLQSSAGKHDKALKTCLEVIEALPKFPGNERLRGAPVSYVQILANKYFAQRNKGEEPSDSFQSVLDEYSKLTSRIHEIFNGDFFREYGFIFEYAQLADLGLKLKIIDDPKRTIGLYKECLMRINSIPDDFFRTQVAPKIENGFTGYGIEYLAGRIFALNPEKKPNKEFFNELIKNGRADPLILTYLFLLGDGIEGNSEVFEKFKEMLESSPVFPERAKASQYLSILDFLYNNVSCTVDAVLFAQRLGEMAESNKAHLKDLNIYDNIIQVSNKYKNIKLR